MLTLLEDPVGQQGRPAVRNRGVRTARPRPPTPSGRRSGFKSNEWPAAYPLYQRGFSVTLKAVSRGDSMAKARKANAAFMKPVTPSAALSEIVGSKPIPRTEVTKKLWAYIKKNSLQDPKNKRNDQSRRQAEDGVRRQVDGQHVRDDQVGREAPQVTTASAAEGFRSIRPRGPSCRQVAGNHLPRSRRRSPSRTSQGRAGSPAPTRHGLRDQPHRSARAATIHCRALPGP